MKIDLSGKAAIVTGGGRGIGRAIAGELCASGVDVTVFDVENALSDSFLDDARAKGWKSRARTLDVRQGQDVAEAVRWVEENAGGVDILVNDAGVSIPKPFSECDVRDWDHVIGINLTGTFNLCHAVFPDMLARRTGCIVNISSIAGKLGGGFLGTAIYAASKAGIIGLTKGLALEGGPFGVRANAICPGVTRTALASSLLEGAKADIILSATPLRRFGEPEDIARAVLFLVSDLASHITGEVMDVDGGYMRD